LLLALLPMDAAAQVGRGRLPPAAQNRRAALQRQVVQQFVEQSARELNLNSNERNRIQQILMAGDARRQQLAQEAALLRRRLNLALRDPQTEDATFDSILNEMASLREREYQMWRQEHDELARTLPPRKRAQMTVRLLLLQERIRTLINQRPPGVVDTTGDTLSLPGTPR
jgi:hypothetical protein